MLPRQMLRYFPSPWLGPWGQALPGGGRGSTNRAHQLLAGLSRRQCLLSADPFSASAPGEAYRLGLGFFQTFPP